MKINLREILHLSCVYLLVEKKTGKRYVGATVDLRNRIKNHISSRGCVKISSMKILQIADRSLLPKLELKWIKRLQPELNKRKTFTYGAGVIRSIATRKRMSICKKGKRLGPHDHGDKISASLKGVSKSKSHRDAMKRSWTKARRARMSKAMNKPWSIARREAQNNKRSDNAQSP